MKNLARPSFFRMFDLLLSATNPGLNVSRWTHDGAEFERERHSFTSPRYSLTVEIFTVTRSGRKGWSLMVAKEYWWAGPKSEPFKNARWARAMHGQRGDLFTWLRAQEVALERSASFGRSSAGAVPDEKDLINETVDHEPAFGRGRSVRARMA